MLINRYTDHREARKAYRDLKKISNYNYSVQPQLWGYGRWQTRDGRSLEGKFRIAHIGVKWIYIRPTPTDRKVAVKLIAGYIDLLMA